MELSEGRPLDTEGRLEKEVRVYDLLDQLGITYWRTDHEAAGTMEDCNEIDRILDVLICKNLFLCNRQKTKFYMLMMPGDKPFKTKELSAQIHSARLSFAPEEYNKMTACGLRKAVFPCEKALREKSAFFDKAIETGVRIW